MVGTEEIEARASGREAATGELLGCHSGAEEGLGVHLQGQHGVQRISGPSLPCQEVLAVVVWC